MIYFLESISVPCLGFLNLNISDGDPLIIEFHFKEFIWLHVKHDYFFRIEFKFLAILFLFILLVLFLTMHLLYSGIIVNTRVIFMFKRVGQPLINNLKQLVLDILNNRIQFEKILFTGNFVLEFFNLFIFKLLYNYLGQTFSSPLRQICVHLCII